MRFLRRIFWLALILGLPLGYLADRGRRDRALYRAEPYLRALRPYATAALTRMMPYVRKVAGSMDTLPPVQTYHEAERLRDESKVRVKELEKHLGEEGSQP